MTAPTNGVTLDTGNLYQACDRVAGELREKGYEVYPVSAASRAGLPELTYAMARLIQKDRAAAVVEERTRIVLRPVAQLLIHLVRIRPYRSERMNQS